MTKRLNNKIALITGATSGIGRATALLFAKEGASIIVTRRRKKELQTLVQEIVGGEGKAIALPGNVKQESHASALVALAVETYGGLDIAFNNAGTLGAMGATHQVEHADWQETLDVNLSSAFLGAKYQVPQMLKRGAGSVIFTSTFVGHTVGMPQMAAYAASKAGLLGFTQALAAEYSPQGIRINALLPGGTDTPMGRTVADSPEALEFVKNLHALKRIASPDEIAQSALYLASDASSFVTGSSLLVDGGVSIMRT